MLAPAHFTSALDVKTLFPPSDAKAAKDTASASVTAVANPNQCKADLGLALVARYRHGFLDALRAIEADSADPFVRLERYAELYGSVLRKRRMCMCGMLAADLATLPKGMRESVALFFAESEAWLRRILDGGRNGGELEFEEAAASMAAFFVSSLEGAMLVARGGGNLKYFDSVAQRLLASVRPSKTKAKRQRGWAYTACKAGPRQRSPR